MILSALVLLAPPVTPILWKPLGEPGCGGAMTDLAFHPKDSKRVLVCGDMLGIGLSTDGGESWGPTFGLGSNEVGSASWSPTEAKTVWVGTMGGPYVSTDGGLNWKLKRRGFPPISGGSYSAPVERVLYDPSDPKRLIALGGSSRRWEANSGDPAWGAVWESKDAGESWAKVGQIGDPKAKTNGNGSGRNIVDGAFVGKALVVSVDSNGLFRSDDGGRTFVKVGAGLPHEDVRRLVQDPRNPRILYTSMGSFNGAKPRKPGGIYKSTDGGLNFVPMNSGLPQSATDDPNQSSNYQALAISPKNPDVLFTGDAAWNTGVIYRSKDGGRSWTPLATKGNIGKNDGVGSLPKVETATFAGLAPGNLDVAPDGTTVLASNSEWIVKSSDGGDTWRDVSSRKNPDGSWTGTGYTGWCSRGVYFDPYQKGRTVVQAMDAARAWVSDDGLKSWRYGEGFDQPWNCGAAFVWAKDGRAWAGFGQFNNFGGIGVSKDGGRTWALQSGEAHGLPKMGQGDHDPNALVCDPENPSRAWAALNGKLYATTDGSKWSRDAGMTAYVSSLARDRQGRLVAGTDQGLMRFEGGWKPLGGPQPVTQMTIAGDGTVLCTSKESVRSGVYRYKGGAWTRLLDETYAAGIAVDPTDANRILVTTGEDPYMDLDPTPGTLASSDGGATWQVIQDGLPMRRAGVVAFDPFDPKTIVVGTYGRGFWRASWPKTASFVGERTYRSNSADADYTEMLDWKDQPAVTLRNGAFDTDAGGWEDKWTERGDVRGVWDPAGKDGGALRVETVGDAKGQLSQMHDGREGQRFRLIGWVKSAGKVKVNVAVNARDEKYAPMDFQQAAYTQNDSDWQAFDKTVVLPKGARHFSVIVFLEGEGKAWVDGLRALPVN